MEKFPLLDVVIGLSLIYTFLSVFASEFTEMTIKLLRWRSKLFQRTILVLLGESSQFGEAKPFKATLTSRVLHSSLLAPVVDTLDQRRQLLIQNEVYSQLVAEAVLEVLQKLSPLNHPDASTDNPAAIMDRLKFTIESAPELSPHLRMNLRRMMHRVQRLDTNPARQLWRLQEELADWFNHALLDAMVTYRFHFKLLSLLVSAGLVITVNIDSLYIIRRISENTATRAMVLQNSAHIQSCRDNLNSPKCAERLSRLLESTTIPLGWTPANRRQQFARLNHVVILRTIGGWLLTSLAVAMGSRFWLRVFRRLAAAWSPESKSS